MNWSRLPGEGWHYGREPAPIHRLSKTNPTKRAIGRAVGEYPHERGELPQASVQFARRLQWPYPPPRANRASDQFGREPDTRFQASHEPGRNLDLFRRLSEKIRSRGPNPPGYSAGKTPCRD